MNFIPQKVNKAFPQQERLIAPILLYAFFFLK